MAHCNAAPRARPFCGKITSARSGKLTETLQDQAMAFADNIKQLPPISHLAEMQLLDASGAVVASIENKPGKAGSLALYNALAVKHGSINVAAAKEGLDLFAEHVADARANPGKHPNVDRLFEVIATGKGYTVKLVPA